MIVCVKSETIAVTSEAITLGAVGKDVTSVKVYAEGSIRFWTSGKVPNGTDGIPMYDGTEREFSVYEASKFKAIRRGNTDAAIHVQHYRVS